MQSKEKFLTVDDHNVFCWKVAHPVQQVYIVANSTESTSRAYSYKYLEVLWLPKRTQLWACFHTEPNRLYRRLRSFPSKLQEYTPPPFSRLSTQYHIDPLLTFFLSILHERVCDYSRVQSSVTGILRMGDMNIHITWLTHVRTGPKKKKSQPGRSHITTPTGSIPNTVFRTRSAAVVLATVLANECYKQQSSVYLVTIIYYICNNSVISESKQKIKFCNRRKLILQA